MITIAVMSLLFVGIYIWWYRFLDLRDLGEKAFFTFLYLCLGGGLFFVLTLWLTHFEGINPDYAKGRVAGHLVSVHSGGTIWKTTGGCVKYGEHQDHSIYVTFKPEQAAEMLKHVGAYIEVDYDEWLVMPFREGSSGRKATAVRILRPAVEKFAQ